MNCTSRPRGLMRTASTTRSTASYVAPTSNTALRTIRLCCASDPVGGSRIGPTNYATTLVAPPAATRAQLFSIQASPTCIKSVSISCGKCCGTSERLLSALPIAARTADRPVTFV
jgi:hypothetical protein